MSEAPEVRAQLSPAEAKLGDLITLDIQVSHPEGVTVELPAFSGDLGAFEVWSSTRLPSQIRNQQTVELFQAQLQSFATGQHTLPGIDVPYRAGSENARVKTPELKITIVEVPAGPHDKGDIRGIKGVIGPTAWSPWWWVLAALVLSAFGVWFWRRRRRLIEGPPPPPPVPADVKALADLRALRESGLLEAGKIKEFYSAISDIVRGYLEAGFEIQALERTTYELMRDLRKLSGMNGERQGELRMLLESCDLVKFAKFKPAMEEALKDHDAAVKFIEITRPLLPAAGREKAGDEGPHPGPLPVAKRLATGRGGEQKS